MSKINLQIEADSAEEMKNILAQFVAGGIVTEPSKELNIQVASEEIIGKKKGITKKKNQETDSTDSTSDTEPSKTGEQAESSKKNEIKQEKATETRYFLHKPNNKTFVVKKGEGVPVEAVHYGEAVELTKEEYAEFNGKKVADDEKSESKTETTDEIEIPTKDEMIALIRKGMDKKLSKEIKELFGNYGAEKFPGIAEKDYPALKIELEGLVN